MDLQIYIDGSHIKGTKVKGYGVWCRHNGIEYSMSGIATPEQMKSEFGILHRNISNPTMELLACCKALQQFRGLSINIRFYVDYIGVGKWIRGEWVANKRYIQILVQHCRALIRSIDGVVSFIDVTGHSGNHGNDKADALAKNRRTFNNFPDLVNELLL